MGRKARKRKREKKRLAEAEAKFEEEQAKKKGPGGFVEDVVGRPLTKKRRLEVKKQAQEQVARLTGEDLAKTMIVSWTDPVHKKAPEQKKIKKPREPLVDLWGADPGDKPANKAPDKLLRWGVDPGDKPANKAPKNRTVDLETQTFLPASYQSINPSTVAREEGLEAVGKHWEKYDGKRIAEARQREAEEKACLAEEKKRLAEEKFLKDESSEEEVEPGLTPKKTPTERKTKAQRNKAKRHKALMNKLAAKKELKKFNAQFSKLKSIKKELDAREEAAKAKPKTEKVVRRRSANSKAFEPLLPLLLTTEELKESKAALRKTPAHPDLMHDVVNTLQAKRVLNPYRKTAVCGQRRRNAKVKVQVRIGEGRGVALENVKKRIKEQERKQAKA